MAIATAVPAAGALAIYIRAGIGAIASQAWVNPYLGIDGLHLLSQGKRADEVLSSLIAADAGIETRQIGIVDAHGRAVAFTGVECPPTCGHRTGDGFAVQGNLLANEATLDAMALSLSSSTDREIDERLMLALETGQEAGGDRRGKQSAALKIVGTEEYALVDLRVDDHANPINELRRILTLARVQLLPLVKALPSRTDPIGTIPAEVGTILMLAPHQRPKR